MPPLPDVPFTSDPSGERGAVLVHVAFVLLALMAFSMLVLDFGVLWVGRRQAQNSADAAALAGAVSLAFDNPTMAVDTAVAKEGAFSVSQANAVWGQPPAVAQASDINIGLCPDGTNTCVRVDVFRHEARGNPLPMYFGRLIGLETQGVRATATAMVQPANATGCLKPWGLPDRWVEHYPVDGPWLPTSTFDVVDKHGNPLPHPDVYIPPTEGDAGTGFNVEADFGLLVTLKPTRDPVSPGFYAALQLTGSGGSDYRYNISHCSNVTWAIGDRIPIEPGNMVGPTTQGVQDLIALDPGAVWTGGPSPISGSCVEPPSTCPGYSMSPRIVAVPVYDVNQWVLEGEGGGHATVIVRNILGFFVSGLQGNDVMGYLMTGPGIYDPGAGGVTSGSAFLRTVVMVR